jgi:SAM-dependent methyltransferase
MDAALYDNMARLESTYWWFVAKRNIIDAMLTRFCPPAGGGEPKKKVCDVGCGTGGMLLQLRDRYDVVGTDSAPEARAWCAERGLDVRDGRLPGELAFAAMSFDAIIMGDVFEHLEQDKASAVALAGLLKPGGVLITTVPAHPWMWSKRDEFHHHYRRYTWSQFVSLFQEARLAPEVQTYYNIATFPLMIAARLGKKLTGIDKAEADIRPLPGLVNGALRWSFEAEKWVLHTVPSPIGASLLGVHRRV